MSDPGRDDPHGGQPVRTAGTPLPEARAAVIMVHGRGASAEMAHATGSRLVQDAPMAAAARIASGG